MRTLWSVGLLAVLTVGMAGCGEATGTKLPRVESAVSEDQPVEAKPVQNMVPAGAESGAATQVVD